MVNTTATLRRTQAALAAALKGKTIEEVSADAGVPVATIRRELTEAAGTITLTQLEAVAGSLNVKPSALLIGGAA